MPVVSTTVEQGLPLIASLGLGVLLLFLPGFALWRLLLSRSPAFRQLCQEEWGFWSALLVQITISVIITGWIAYVMAELGVFSVLLLAGIILTFCLALFIASGPRDVFKHRGYCRMTFRVEFPSASSGGKSRKTLPFPKRYLQILKHAINDVLLRNESLYIPILIAVAFFMFTPPIQNVWRGRRDGAETLCGIRLAAKGGFLASDDFLEKLPEEDKEALFNESKFREGGERLVRFPSFFVIPDPESSKTYPAFLHFHGTWMGIACSTLGIPGLYYISPILATLSIGVIFLFVNSLSSVKTAFLATLLLTVNIMQIYFVRFSSSVITAQLLVFAGLYFFMIFSRSGVWIFGVLSGVAFGQAVLCGNGLFHYIVLAGFLSLCATFNPRKHARIHYAFPILSFMLFISQAVVFDFIAGTNNLLIFGESLTRSIIGPNMPGSWEPHLATAVTTAGVFAAVLVILSSASLLRRKESPRVFRSIVSFKNGLIIRLLGYVPIAVYFIWFYSTRKPYIETDEALVYPNQWVHKFIDEIGLMFLIIGVGFFMYFRFYRKRHHMVFFPMFLFLIFALENIWHPGPVSILPYGFRKFIPIFLPFAYFLVAYSLFAFRELTRNLEFGRYFGGTIAIAALILMMITAKNGLLLKKQAEGYRISASVLDQYEDRVLSKLRRADISNEEAVFLFGPSLRDPMVPMTLDYVYGVSSVELPPGFREDETTVAAVEHLMQSDRKVFLVVQGVEVKEPREIGSARLIPFGEASISIARVSETRGERIKRIVKKGDDPTVLKFYRLVGGFD